MTQLETLSSVQGRALVREIYRELRYQRRLGTLQVIGAMWRICCTEQELLRLTRHDVMVIHPLGWWQGSSLWMEEVVNRFYFSPINAWVYAGAALLLVSVGLNRVGAIHQPGLVVGGIILEAVLLLLLFVVMYFTPPEEDEPAGTSGEPEATIELLREIGEIGRDYAAMAVQLEAIAVTLTDMVEKQDEITASMRDGVNAAVQAVAPNPQLLATMSATTEALQNLSQSIGTLDVRLKAMETDEVERLVRLELERILSSQILRTIPAK